MNLDDFESYSCQKRTHAELQQYYKHCYVYRYWNDIAPAGHQLLYIGFSKDFYARDRAHWMKSLWRRQATRVDVEVYPNERDALTAEWKAIIAEVPIYNTTHTDVARWQELHGDWMEFVENRHDPVADKRCAEVMEWIFAGSA